MKRISLKIGIASLQQVALRFPMSLFFLIALSTYIFLDINNKELELQPRMWAFFSIGVFLSLATTLLTENLKNKFLSAGLNLLATSLLLIFVFTLPDKFQLVDNFQLIALGVVFSLSAFFVSYFPKNNDIPFWEFGKTNILQLIISYVFSGVLMIGLSLAVLSLKELFKIDIQPEVYANLSVVCFVLFGPIYFLTKIPTIKQKFKQEYSFDNFLKILGLYILLPILLLYFFILYVYLIQIVIKWELPNGWVSTLVSTLALGGFLCMLILYPLRLQNDKKVDVFSRYFPLLILPLLVLMSIGIFRRIADYGLSINRCYVLMLNIWLYGISIYLFVSKSKHLKWMIVSFAAITFVVSVGPWSVFNITKRSIVPQMEQQLISSGLWSKDKMISFDDLNKLTQKQKEAIFYRFSYLFENYGVASVQYIFKDSLKKKNIWELKESIGLNQINPKTIENKQFNFTQPYNTYFIKIDSSYKSLLRVRINKINDTPINNKNFKIKLIKNTLTVQSKDVNATKIVVNLDLKVREIIGLQKVGDNFTLEELTITGVNYKLSLTQIMGTYNAKTDVLKIENVNANLFLK